MPAEEEQEITEEMAEVLREQAEIDAAYEEEFWGHKD